MTHHSKLGDHQYSKFYEKECEPLFYFFWRYVRTPFKFSNISINGKMITDFGSTNTPTN